MQYQIENHGSIVLVRPLTDECRQWLLETAPDDAQFLGDALAVEPRYVAGVEDALAAAGFGD